MAAWNVETYPDPENRSRRVVRVVGPNDAVMYPEVGNGTAAERLKLANLVARLLNQSKAAADQRWAEAVLKSHRTVDAMPEADKADAIRKIERL